MLKNLSGVKFFSKINLRKSLIVLQFTLSLFFIITALIIHKQSGLLINSEYGFAKENIINIKLKDANAEQYLIEIKKRTDVIQASASSHIPATLTNRNWHSYPKLARVVAVFYSSGPSARRRNR